MHYMKSSVSVPEVFQRIKNGLVVSCIGDSSDPQLSGEFMACMAYAAKSGGAAGIRANGPEVITSIRTKMDLPIIGLFKAPTPGFNVSITPTLSHAEMVAAAGADMIEIDATQMPHPEGMLVEELIRQVKRRTGKLVIADVSTAMEGILAANAGADGVMTTLAGYTSYSQSSAEPDYELVATLSKRLHIPLIANGRFNTPEKARKAIDLGAYAVVVGSAITRPQLLTEKFAHALK
jgi:N-acylglucosamine-6-phosphate 2-epimerase